MALRSFSIDDCGDEGAGEAEEKIQRAVAHNPLRMLVFNRFCVVIKTRNLSEVLGTPPLSKPEQIEPLSFFKLSNEDPPNPLSFAPLEAGRRASSGGGSSLQAAADNIKALVAIS